MATYGGTLLRIARGRAGLDHDALARRLGLPARTIERWERDGRVQFDDVVEALYACGFELRLAECDDPTLAAALEPRLDLDAKGRIDDMLRRRDQRAQQ